MDCSQEFSCFPHFRTRLVTSSPNHCHVCVIDTSKNLYVARVPRDIPQYKFSLSSASRTTAAMASVAAQKPFHRSSLPVLSLTLPPSPAYIHYPVDGRKSWQPLSSGAFQIPSAKSGVRRKERKLCIVEATTDDKAAQVEEGT